MFWAWVLSTASTYQDVLRWIVFMRFLFWYKRNSWLLVIIRWGKAFSVFCKLFFIAGTVQFFINIFRYYISTRHDNYVLLICHFQSEFVVVRGIAKSPCIQFLYHEYTQKKLLCRVVLKPINSKNPLKIVVFKGFLNCLNQILCCISRLVLFPLFFNLMVNIFALRFFFIYRLFSQAGFIFLILIFLAFFWRAHRFVFWIYFNLTV